MKIILLFSLLFTSLLAAQTQNENFVTLYFKEIIGFIIILTLFIIFLITRKNKHAKKQNLDVFSNDTRNIKTKEVKPKVEKNINQVNNNKTQNNEPIIINKVDEPKNTESIVIEKVADVKEKNQNTSSIEIKKIKQYTKKKKDDFKDFKDSRIMIAEDNMINQKVVSGLLSTSGIHIVIVDDGLEAINYLKKDNDFCIILMDAHMPNMDGYEATKLIRQEEKYQHITVVALSGDTATDDIRKMKEAGMQEHLEKPLRINALYSVLAAYSFNRKDGVDLNKKILSNNNSGQELSTELGIEICGGDEGFYKEILKDFINDYSDSITKIQNFLNNNKFSKVDELLLDISGVVANIGATNIENLVKGFKLSLKTPDDEKYILLFKQYAKHHRALENEIRKYLAQ